MGERVINVNEGFILEKKIDKISKEIIEILSNENITHAIANIILENVKNELQNTIVKKCEYNK